ncbi:hypothetical protein OG864_51840 [Streptomyces sp. NBC_00124]|uniref:hypothetical protein n=1 Tax=Streptomyces sp. NBC_00124 TaxID=2975662 RepID=UPI00224D1E24|nr:hypothetical protein [Streptomyces sp. NBC_00124]MCX5367173.1 hypothetical protein [Streptomyces sp. NBC_00124]
MCTTRTEGHASARRGSSRNARTWPRIVRNPSHLGYAGLRARREEAELPALVTDGRAQLAAGRTRLEKGRRGQLATVVGPVTVTRCALRAPGLPNCRPADQVLGLPRERHSLGLRRLVVLEAARGSYDHALEAIGRRCGTPAVGKRQAEQLVRAAAGGHRRLLCRPHPHFGSQHDAAGAQRRRQGDRDAPGSPAGRDAVLDIVHVLEKL